MSKSVALKKGKGFHQRAIGSITIVLHHSAINSDLTDIFLNENLRNYDFKLTTYQLHPVVKLYLIFSCMFPFVLFLFSIFFSFIMANHVVMCTFIVFSSKSLILNYHTGVVNLAQLALATQYGHANSATL